MEYELINNKDLEFVSLLISPAADDVAVIIMLQDEVILRFFIANKENEDFRKQHELQSYQFDSRQQALDFANNITKNCVSRACQLKCVSKECVRFLTHTVYITLPKELFHYEFP